MQSLSQSPREPEFVQNPYPFYDRARAAGDLFLWEDYEHLCSARYDIVNAILRDRRFGREIPGDPKPPVAEHLKHFCKADEHSMLDREPPVHTRLKSQVMRAFTSRRIAALTPEIIALAHELADAIESGEFDLLTGFAERLPVIVIARLLGVPDTMSDQLLSWSHDMVAMYQIRRDRVIEERADLAAREFSDFLRQHVEKRRKSPGDDLITELIAAETGGGKLSIDELISTCILLLNAGHEATVHVIGNGVNAILASDEDPAQLFCSPKSTAATVEEMIRFDPPLHLFTRMAVEDVEVFGHRFSRGETVGCLLAAANRDPARFESHDVFLPHRKNAGTNLSFGAGIHFCLGAPLARSELCAALPVLFGRFPGLKLAQVPVFADRYHFRGLEELRLHR